MEKDTRNSIERATQRARGILEKDFAEQLQGGYDIMPAGRVGERPGAHLTGAQRALRARIVAAIEHKRAQGMKPNEAVADYLRDAAFTTLNRFVALKMLEARDLVQECVSKGEASSGFANEFCGLAPGLKFPDGSGYRLYIESIFDELSTEVKVLFDRRDPASALWPRKTVFDGLLATINSDDLKGVWGEEETIGWVYQYFNGQDERRKMREESQAPRNSRELAIRNQFFTPRYVVQFLTDNTLGRIWYEMRGANTVLAERCEYMVRRPGEEFALRAKKDPRDLRVLDPACGSGHFLLYAFDLLLAIYEEAHADPESPKSKATSRTLVEDYPSVDALRKAVPGLILAHNLHGVDIDPRCAQIAQLALWMRAQKAYRDFGIARGERPQIRRSNIIVAEPLVADEQVAKEFVTKLGDEELGQIFTALVRALNLAGDLGLLLRVETLVGHRSTQGQFGDLFAPPEERIRAALEQFVSEEGANGGMRRRLFADDAAHGVALLGVAEKRFDVVLMNPPFGAGSTRAKKDFERAYPKTKSEVYGAFVERGVELLLSNGRLGAITSRTGFFLSSFQKWREDVLLDRAPPITIADLGLGVMDAASVEFAAYCLERAAPTGNRSTVFIRLLEEVDDKEQALRAALRNTGRNGVYFDCDPRSFSEVPGSPFAYWVSDDVRALFRTHPPLERADRYARRGSSTGDDFRRVRAWWEVPVQHSGCESRWKGFAKGGAFSRYYSDIHLAAAWDSRRGTYEGFLGRAGRETERPEAAGEYFRPGLTWPRRTDGLSFRVLPRGCIFADKGPAVFIEDDPSERLLALAAVLNSRPYGYLVAVQIARTELAQSFEVGIIQQTPVPYLGEDDIVALAHLARRAWSLKRTLDTTNETSHAFLLPSGLNEKVTDLNRLAVERELESLQKQIDEAVFTLYGIGLEDRAVIEASSKRANSNNTMEGGKADEDGDELGEGGPFGGVAADALIPWLVGVVFGRYDPRLATGERSLPPNPEPFDPLPRRSPGMWPDGEGPPRRPDMLVDDEGHADDLVALMRVATERVRVNAPENLRPWLAKEFFPLHIKMYSRSRRKAPIYWQLATTSASYSVWLYNHAFTNDTLFRIQNDYVAPKLAHEARRLESLTMEHGDKGSAAQRKELASQEAFVEELRAFLEEAKRVAPLWNPNLDDGVIINFAPLWRLVPQHKAWQNELKATWDSLCSGDYDWARLAMHLWPERVVPKCATDRSLAIAHGVEEVFWVESEDGKWKPRDTPVRPVSALVAERSSQAVKAALKNLLEAPDPSGPTKRGRKSKAA